MGLPPFSSEQRHRIARIGHCYQRLTGRLLVSAGSDQVEALWSSPLAIVAHGPEPDPIFFFGNRTALELFEMNFDTFTRLPSRLSAEPLLRDERARLLERVTRDGLIEDYTGVRIASTGRRFRISNATVWTLFDETGEPAGQAAAFAEWAYLPTARY